MDSAEVGVLEESNEVCLSSLLESKNCRALESEVSLELLSNLANQALEWELANEELSRLLVSPDFSEGDSAWAISVGLLHAASGGGVLAGCLGGELLTRGPEGRRVEKRRKGLGGFEARRSSKPKAGPTVCSRKQIFNREVACQNKDDSRRAGSETHLPPVDLRAVCFVRAI